MARTARVILPGIPHHVTQRGVRSMNVFKEHKDYTAYRELLHTQCKKHGVEILAYCLMTNHVHLVAVPETEESLARAVGETHRLYTRRINFREGVRGWLFQGRFFSTPLDETHFLAAIRYVEQNPVRAKMVEKAWDYPFSSAPFHAGVAKEDPVLSGHPLLDEITDWEGFVAATPGEIDTIREKTRTGRPCGDEGFYAMAERVTGRSLAPKKPGRRRK